MSPPPQQQPLRQERLSPAPQKQYPQYYYEEGEPHALDPEWYDFHMPGQGGEEDDDDDEEDDLGIVDDDDGEIEAAWAKEKAAAVARERLRLRQERALKRFSDERAAGLGGAHFVWRGRDMHTAQVKYFNRVQVARAQRRQLRAEQDEQAALWDNGRSSRAHDANQQRQPRRHQLNFVAGGPRAAERRPASAAPTALRKSTTPEEINFEGIGATDMRAFQKLAEPYLQYAAKNARRATYGR